jgi:hypothetical protein
VAAAERDECLTARLRRILRSVPARCATTCARTAVEPLPALWNWNPWGRFGDPTVCAPSPDWGYNHERIIQRDRAQFMANLPEYMAKIVNQTNFLWSRK